MQVTILFLILFGIFLAVMPFVAIWNIWTLLQKIEKHHKVTNEKLVELLKKEI